MKDLKDLISAAHAEARDNAIHRAIANLIETAERAQAYRAHGVDRDGEPRHMVRQPAAASNSINVREALMPSLFDKDGNLKRIPGAKLAATTAKMDAGIIAGSRIAAAGANLIFYNDPTKALPVGKTGDVVLSRVPASFRLVAPSPFAVVTDDADVSVSALPVSSAAIDFSTAPNLVVRFNLTRAARRDLSDDELSAEVSTAVTLGLARAADATLLAALSAATLTDFTIARAASKGLRWDELRALVGTAGNGAAIDAAGALRAAGVAAELTNDMAKTLVGAFDRSAVAIHENLQLHAERTSLKGDLTFTCWANLIPLLPDTGYFWTAPAVAP